MLGSSPPTSLGAGRGCQGAAKEGSLLTEPDSRNPSMRFPGKAVGAFPLPAQLHRPASSPGILCGPFPGTKWSKHTALPSGQEEPPAADGEQPQRAWPRTGQPGPWGTVPVRQPLALPLGPACPHLPPSGRQPMAPQCTLTSGLPGELLMSMVSPGRRLPPQGRWSLHV